MPDDLERRIRDDFPEITNYDGRLAFGIRDFPSKGQTQWSIVRFVGGRVTEVSTHALTTLGTTHEALHVSVAISAPRDVWLACAKGDFDSFLNHVKLNHFALIGEAPYFIRFLRDIVEAARGFAGRL